MGDGEVYAPICPRVIHGTSHPPGSTIGDGEATLMQEADAAAALKLVRHGRPVFELFVEAPLPDVRGIAPNDVSPINRRSIYITGELQGDLSVQNDERRAACL